MNGRGARSIVLLAVLGASIAACGPITKLRQRLGLAPDGIPDRDPTPLPTSTAVSQFPRYIVEAFPDARHVRTDPRAPRLSIAAEEVLTSDEPHLRRGPPRFSPDGRLLAYEELDRDTGRRWIAIRRLDGAMIRRLPLREPTGPEDVTKPLLPESATSTEWSAHPLSWAPSSDGFAFTRETEMGAYEVVVSDLAGEAKRISGPPAVDGSAVWSPAGDRVAYLPATRIGEIWAADPTVRKASPLAVVDVPVHSFAFSGDGARIVFSAGEVEDRDVRVLDLETSKPGAPPREPRILRITRWPFDDLRPSFSPDGKWISFYSSYRPRGAPKGWSLLVVGADGSDAMSGAALMDRTVAKTVSPHFATAPSWSPDGKWVAVVEPRTEDYQAIVLHEIARRVNHELAPDSITNEDVTVSVDGVLAYRSRQEWGDHIVIALTARGATRVER